VNARRVLGIAVVAALAMCLSVTSLAAHAGGSPADGVRPERLLRFRGVIERRPQDPVGMWAISGRQIEVVEDTRIDETHGPAEVGAHVLVLAWRPATTDASSAVLRARLIQVLKTPDEKPVTIRGKVTALETTYVEVDETRILYDRSTEIVGHLEVGAYVKVRAVRTDEGLKALTIHVLPSDDTIVEFEGLIERIGHPDWVIGGRRVTVARQTEIIGRPEVGLWAKVRAEQSPSGKLLALRIVVENAEPVEVEWTGIIERLPPSVAVRPPHCHGQWIVGGRAVMITSLTRVEGTPRIGLTAHVVAVQYPGRLLTARLVQILSVQPADPSLSASAG
jgi:hypothetical protein